MHDGKLLFYMSPNRAQTFWDSSKRINKEEFYFVATHYAVALIEYGKF